MASSQDLYNIHLKTSLFKAKLYYNDFMRFRILLRKPKNLEAQRINCTVKEAKATSKQFSSDFRCSKNIWCRPVGTSVLPWLSKHTYRLTTKQYNMYLLSLKISQSKRLLMFVLNLKRCFNAKKEALSSMYWLITLNKVIEMV